MWDTGSLNETIIYTLLTQARQIWRLRLLPTYWRTLAWDALRLLPSSKVMTSSSLIADWVRSPQCVLVSWAEEKDLSRGSLNPDRAKSLSRATILFSQRICTQHSVLNKISIVRHFVFYFKRGWDQPFVHTTKIIFNATVNSVHRLYYPRPRTSFHWHFNGTLKDIILPVRNFVSIL